jgi:hypothetical protein
MIPQTVIVEPRDLSGALQQYNLTGPNSDWIIVFEPPADGTEAVAWLSWTVAQSELAAMLDQHHPCLSYQDADDNWIAWEDAPADSGSYTASHYDLRYILAVS